MKIRTDILERKEDILNWIEEGQSKAFICRELHCKPETLNSYLTKMGIEYKGNQGLKGFDHPTQYKTALEYINSNTIISSHKLRNKLLKDGIKKYQCEICGLTEWQNKPIPLELHHIDGNHYNNNLDNLQILCPNCHALETNDTQVQSQKVKKIIPKTEKFCIDCGKGISPNAIRCKSCETKNRYKEISPQYSLTREELKDLIRTKPFTQIANIYHVSDNAIRKWCDNFNLPRKKKDIDSYSDEEWSKI